MNLGLHVVDGWIAIGRPQRMSCSSMQARRRLESLPEPPRHQTRGGLRCRAVSNRPCTPQIINEEGHTADTRSERGSYLQRLASGLPTNGAPGTRAGAASIQVDQPEGEDPSQGQH